MRKTITFKKYKKTIRLKTFTDKFSFLIQYVVLNDKRLVKKLKGLKNFTEDDFVTSIINYDCSFRLISKFAELFGITSLDVNLDPSVKTFDDLAFKAGFNKTIDVKDFIKRTKDQNEVVILKNF